MIAFISLIRIHSRNVYRLVDCVRIVMTCAWRSISCVFHILNKQIAVQFVRNEELFVIIYRYCIIGARFSTELRHTICTHCVNLQKNHPIHVRKKMSLVYLFSLQLEK